MNLSNFLSMKTFSLQKSLAVLITATACALPLTGCDLQLGNSDDNDSSSGGTGGGGGGTGGGSSGGDDDGRDGDDGGAIIGTLTDASRLEVNFDTDLSLGNIDIFIDGIPADSSELEDGMVVTLVTEEDTPNNLATATVIQLDANHLFVGPVTSTNPFSVFTQPIVTTADTELEAISGENVANLSVGDVVRVSGFDNRVGGILATRVDTPPGGFALWKLRGVVENLVANDSFTIADQTIVLNGVVADCGEDELAEGDYVEVTATPDDSFDTGDDLTSTLTVSCITVALPALRNNDEDVDFLPAQMEGIVSSVRSITEIMVDDQTVEIDSDVVYFGGTANDLVIGSKIEVEGTYNIDTQELAAETIIYHERRIFIEAPLRSQDITVNESVNFFGVEIPITGLTVDDDLIVSSGVANNQVRLFGFTDEDQNPYAIQLSVEGAIDDEDVTVQGPVSRVGSSEVEILGISADGGNIQSFLSSVEEEDLILIEGAEVDGSTSITGGIISEIPTMFELRENN